MSPTPKTIQIFLPGGDPSGIRRAEITTRIVRVVEVPRSLLDDFLAMPESGQVAIYFLLSRGDDVEEPRVYIGQTGDLRQRLLTHNKEKEFWERAVVLVSLTDSLTQTHGLFLEWYCLQAARKVARYRIENATSGSCPHTPEPLKAECLEIFETGEILLATLGFPLFEPLAKSSGHNHDDEVFYCSGRGAEGRMRYTPEGFVVLKGSRGPKDDVPSIAGTSDEKLREKLKVAGVLRLEDTNLVFERDHLFRSPSGAAVALLGRTANGWEEWKTKDGRTLDKVKRQPAEAPASKEA